MEERKVGASLDCKHVCQAEGPEDMRHISYERGDNNSTIYSCGLGHDGCVMVAIMRNIGSLRSKTDSIAARPRAPRRYG